MEDKMTVFGDWALPNPSPRSLLTNFLNEEFDSKSFSDIFAENGSNGSLPIKNPEMLVNPKEEAVGDEFDFSNDNSLEPKLFDVRKSSSSGCLAQRIARTGFNAPKINTARIKSENMAFSRSEISSPYLTIPPGLSPTGLLESPVFLSNSMAQPSPTTGKISFKINKTNSLSISASDSAVPDESKNDHLDDNTPAGFSFEPSLNMSLRASSSSSFPCQEDKGPSAIDRPQSLQDTEASFQKDFDFSASFSESSNRKDGSVDSIICLRPTDSFVSNENSTPFNDLPNDEGTQGELSSITVAEPAEDVYSWRKYGQKQVKASEYPRSYYKCTHPNCQAKKMIERSHDGHITEMIYKGGHNHTKPLLHRRPGMPSSHPFNDARADGLEHNGSHVNFDATLTSFGDPIASIQTEDVSLFASPEPIDVSSSVSNDEEEDRAAHGSISLGGEGGGGGEGEGEESESKRRKLDACAVEMSSVSRPLREPRVVIQTTSEVDILDDGYRWRKYGQKVVKGNPNPRSYYKCTYPGCTVRKHVERASHDLGSVITTYEGRHDHEVPAARNSSHSNPAPSGTPPADQRMTLNKRPDPTQETLMTGALGLPGREQQLGFGPGFSFGTGRQGLANVGIGGLGPCLGPSFLR